MVHGLSEEDIGNDAADAVGLLDPVGLKQYLAYENVDSSGDPQPGTCLCTNLAFDVNVKSYVNFDWSAKSSGSSGSGSGSSGAGAKQNTSTANGVRTFYLSALIAAPPANVKAVSFITSFGIIPNLTIAG